MGPTPSSTSSFSNLFPERKATEHKPKLKRDVKTCVDYPKITFPNGNTYEGEVDKENFPNGFGTWTRLSGRKYVGQWLDSVRFGEGTSYRSDGTKNYEGEWANDMPSGVGIAYRKDGSKIYEGNWKDGKPHGTGTLYNPDGSLQWFGVFTNNH